jgi:hypothetical protein
VGTLKNHDSLKFVLMVIPIQTLKLDQVQIFEGMSLCDCSRRTLPIRNTLTCAVIGLPKATARPWFRWMLEDQ